MNHIKNSKKGPSENREIKIFGTENGVSVIDSPIKTKILSLLKNEELNGSDIVTLTSKSKSTISAHLKDLINADIVDYKPDPIDGRRKIFYIKSRYLGELSRDSALKKDENGESQNSVGAVLNDADNTLERHLIQTSDVEDPFKFFKYTLKTIRVSLMEEGVNIDPILHNAGIKVGQSFNDQLQSNLTENLLENISEFWNTNNLGRLFVENLDPLTIRVYDCFECANLPVIGRSACAFDSGILEAIFSSHFRHKMEANEIKCYAKGDEYCCFEITEIQEN
jgi:hypothetical protein